MPQCDPTFAVSQVFWLVVTWLVVLVCIKQYAWPRFSERQQQRQTELQGWVDAAVTRRAEIADWQTAYQQALDVAHTEGRAHTHEAVNFFEKASDKRREAFLSKHHVQFACAPQDTTDVKEALHQWKKACLQILPFS